MSNPAEPPIRNKRGVGARNKSALDPRLPTSGPGSELAFDFRIGADLEIRSCNEPDTGSDTGSRNDQKPELTCTFAYLLRVLRVREKCMSSWESGRLMGGWILVWKTSSCYARNAVTPVSPTPCVTSPHSAGVPTA